MKDIYNISCKVMIEEKAYELEFDNRAYAMVENLLDKGTFKVFQSFVLDNNLKLDECLQVFYAGLVKHHTSAEIEEVKKKCEENPAILHKNLYSLQFAFAKPLILPDVAQQALKKGNGLKKKTQKMKAN